MIIGKRPFDLPGLADPDGLDPAPTKRLAKVGTLIAMELQQIQWHGIQNRFDKIPLSIHEQSRDRHKRRNLGGQDSGLLQINRSRAWRVKHQAYGISATGYRCLHILRARQATYL